MAGLDDRSSRPRHSPRALSRDEVELILAARAASRYGPHRLAYLTGHPRSTISDVLARASMSRLADTDKLTGAPVRYVACHPGALLHQDHKKLGRIPDGGGHRVLGRERTPSRHRGDGYDHFEVFVDDASRVGFVAHVADESPTSAVHALERAAAFYAARGVRIERMLTDNGGATSEGRSKKPSAGAKNSKGCSARRDAADRVDEECAGTPQCPLHSHRTVGLFGRPRLSRPVSQAALRSASPGRRASPESPGRREHEVTVNQPHAARWTCTTSPGQSTGGRSVDCGH